MTTQTRLSSQEEELLHQLRTMLKILSSRPLHEHDEACQLLFNQLNTLKVLTEQIHSNTRVLLDLLQQRGYKI